MEPEKHAVKINNETEALEQKSLLNVRVHHGNGVIHRLPGGHQSPSRPW